MCSFLQADLQNLFNDRGIDVSRYEAEMQFEDPLTLHTSLEGYLFNIQFLRRVFNPTFQLHGIQRTGDLQVTTRWTMDMRLTGMPATGAPLLTFTGVSILDVDPNSRKLCRHVDKWDSLVNNRYLSLEGVGDLVGQLLSGPPSSSAGRGPFVTLLRRKEYQVRRYTSGGKETTVAVAWSKKDARGGGAVAAAQLTAALQRDGVAIAAGSTTFYEDSAAGGSVEVHIPLADGFQLPWTV